MGLYSGTLINGENFVSGIEEAYFWRRGEGGGGEFIFAVYGTLIKELAF